MTGRTSGCDDAGAEWWATAVSRIAPGEILLRGYPVQELVGHASYVDVVWLLLRGELPAPAQSALLEAALVAGVDHGPQAPSVAAARMAATCGTGVNNALATGINLLGDVHGGAGQQCLELLDAIVAGPPAGRPDAARALVDRYRRDRRYLPGFGHRFHRTDPRRAPLLDLVRRAVADGWAAGHHLRAAESVEAELGRGRARPVTMNIDGATAVVYGELGFDPATARGLFVLSRAVGLLAHVTEERRQGTRIKGPMPRDVLPRYTGPDPRRFPATRPVRP